MDQNFTNLPYSKQLIKSDVNLWHLRTHLTGIIIRGHEAFAFLDFLQWPHDPNLTCNILINVTSSIIECLLIYPAQLLLFKN